MLKNLNHQQLWFFAILLVALVLFITEWIRTDVVAVMIVVALYATRVLKADDALSGFSSEPAIVVAGIFVLSGALHVTALSDKIGDLIGKLAGSSLTRAIAVIMPSVSLLSAFTHHVTTTAIMLPVTLDLSRERKIPASKLLMPMSFAASLGTTITIIGAPAFLIASTILQQAGRSGLGIFSISPIGLSLTVAGTLFVLLIGRFLLPARNGSEDATRHFRLEDYLTEITVLPDSPFSKKTIAEIERDGTYHFRYWVCFARDADCGRSLKRNHYKPAMCWWCVRTPRNWFRSANKLMSNCTRSKCTVRQAERAKRTRQPGR